jgi:hypothetical protein
MIFYDDCPLEHWPPYNGIPCTPMPTAIVRFQTAEGFVIAADGRARKYENGKYTVEHDNMQKIYPIPGESLVYVLLGNMKLGKDETDSGGIVVDLVSEVAASVSRLAGQTFKDIGQYADHLSIPILKRLSEAKSSGQIRKFPERASDIEKDRPGHVIGHVLIFGYYNGQPSETDIRFFHREQEPTKQVIPNNLWIGYPPQIWGSIIVAKALFDSADGPFFESERKKLPPRSKNPSIADGIAVASTYIAGCDSDTGRVLDSALCPGIGGRVHIAIIKPDGWDWADGYRSVTAL